MTKRQTKQQRDEALKAALLQRITDIYSGAMGCEWGPDEFATAEILSRAMPVIREVFAIAADSWMVGYHVLGHYNSPQEAAEFLFEQGIRA